MSVKMQINQRKRKKNSAYNKPSSAVRCFLIHWSHHGNSSCSFYPLQLLSGGRRGAMWLCVFHPSALPSLQAQFQLPVCWMKSNGKTVYQTSRSSWPYKLYQGSHCRVLYTNSAPNLQYLIQAPTTPSAFKSSFICVINSSWYGK